MAQPPPDGKTPPRPGTLGRNPAPGTGAGGHLAEGIRVGAPSVSLPKGGGAISGIGEKVSANPVTGSGSLSIPLPLTPGRGGFTPGLALSYSSGAGNGPFGLGCQLGLPSVRRKTDRGLPRYLDLGEKADTYVLSDVEDLVPLLVLDGEDWVPVTREVVDGDDTWTVQRFRPRIEGAFALIERWRRDTDHRTWWRTRSRENTERVYGRTDQTRLTNPDDAMHVFEWLLEQEQDERGCTAPAEA